MCLFIFLYTNVTCHHLLKMLSDHIFLPTCISKFHSMYFLLLSFSNRIHILGYVCIFHYVTNGKSLRMKWCTIKDKHHNHPKIHNGYKDQTHQGIFCFFWYFHYFSTKIVMLTDCILLSMILIYHQSTVLTLLHISIHLAK